MRLSLIVGILAGFFIARSLLRLVPAPSCRDGWDSPSIGIAGACSNHGGVAKSPVPYGIIILVISFLSGAFIAGQLERLERRWLPNREDKVGLAIQCKRPIEFLYKKRGDQSYSKRTVLPEKLVWSGRGGRTRCVAGHCFLRNDVRTFALDRMKDIRIKAAEERA